MNMSKTIKKTTNELFVIHSLLNNNFKDISNNVKTRWGYATKKFIEATKKHLEDFQKERGEVQIELASTDEEGNLIKHSKEEGSDFKYSKENLKKLNKKVQELSEQEHQVKPFFIKDKKHIPKEVKDVEVFAGIFWEKEKEVEPEFAKEFE